MKCSTKLKQRIHLHLVYIFKNRQNELVLDGIVIDNDTFALLKRKRDKLTYGKAIKLLRKASEKSSGRGS